MKRAFCIIGIALLAAAACSFFFNPADTPAIEFAVNDIIETNRESNRFYYDQLTEEEKTIYEVLLDRAYGGDSEYVFPYAQRDAMFETLFTAAKAVYNEHPELFWIRCGYATPKEGENARLNVYNYSYWEYTTDKQARIDALSSRVSAVAAMARQVEGDYERMRFVHDYLIENAVYDFEALEEAIKTIHDPASEYIFSAYGCLVNGRTVCCGYAKAFQLIMRELGYKCIVVQGDAGEMHEWNCVWFDDKCYHVDITWDDSDFDPEEAKWDYFCITEEQICRSRILEDEFEQPVCDSTDGSYLKRNGYCMQTYDFDAFCEIIKRQEKEGGNIYTVAFETVDELGKAVEDFVEKGDWFVIPTFKRFGYIKPDIVAAQNAITFYCY